MIPPASPLYRAAELMDLPRHATVEEAVAALRAGDRPWRRTVPCGLTVPANPARGNGFGRVAVRAVMALDEREAIQDRRSLVRCAVVLLAVLAAPNLWPRYFVLA